MHGRESPDNRAGHRGQLTPLDNQCPARPGNDHARQPSPPCDPNRWNCTTTPEPDRHVPDRGQACPLAMLTRRLPQKFHCPLPGGFHASSCPYRTRRQPCIAIFSIATSAATTPADAIKYRQAVMEGMSAHVTAIALINFGKVVSPGVPEVARECAGRPRRPGQGRVPGGDRYGQNRSASAIWKEQEQFNKLVSDVKTASAKLRMSWLPMTSRHGDCLQVAGRHL